MTLIPTHPFAAAMSDGDALALAGVLLCVVVGCVCYGRGMSKGERDAERRHALTGRHTERVITSRTRKYEIEEVYKVKREVPLPAPQQPPPQALPQPPQESRYLPPPRQRPDEVVDAEFEEKGLPRLPAPRALPPAPWKGGRRDA